jgi:hypothetical protein
VFVAGGKSCKHSNLVRKYVNHRQKSFITLGPGRLNPFLLIENLTNNKPVLKVDKLEAVSDNELVDDELNDDQVSIL